MTDRPGVSVVIPAYNVAEYVGEAIESALAQTYPNVEVVVVDDGSTDSTAAVIDSYRNEVVVVSQENQGLASARNAGIRSASGELFALLDADDLWLTDRLDRLIPVLEARPEIGMVTSDSYVMDGRVPTERRSYVHRRRRPFPASEDEQIAEIARFNFLFVSVVFRRELVDRCGMFAEGLRRAEDYELWTRFLLSGSRAAFVDEPLGYYRVRPGSLSQSPEQAIAHQAVLERHLPALWKQGAKGYARDAYEIGSRLSASGQRRAAIPFFAHALTAEGAEGSRFQFAASALRRLVWPTKSSAS